MPSVNISEADFMAVAHAAYEAHMHGDTERAQTLDKLARKMNAKLSDASVPAPFGRVTRAPKWQDMPSTLPTSPIGGER